MTNTSLRNSFDWSLMRSCTIRTFLHNENMITILNQVPACRDRCRVSVHWTPTVSYTNCKLHQLEVTPTGSYDNDLQAMPTYSLEIS